jgi:hypothetical protein
LRRGGTESVISQSVSRDPERQRRMLRRRRWLCDLACPVADTASRGRPRPNCPCLVRECLPTSPNPDQPGTLRLAISYGASWGSLARVAPDVALIPQRSLVQIQPPQPTAKPRKDDPSGGCVLSGDESVRDPIVRELCGTTLLPGPTPRPLPRGSPRPPSRQTGAEFAPRAPISKVYTARDGPRTDVDDCLAAETVE